MRVAPASAYGFAYSIPSSIAQKLEAYVADWVKKEAVIQGEDVALTCASLLLGAKDNRCTIGEVFSEKYDGALPRTGMKAGHYRNHGLAKAAGIRDHASLMAATEAAMRRDLGWLGVD